MEVLLFIWVVNGNYWVKDIETVSLAIFASIIMKRQTAIGLVQFLQGQA